MRDCVFRNNAPDATSTVTVVSGMSLKIANCCFSGSREKELNVKAGLIDECLFEVAKCETPQLWGNGVYRPGETGDVARHTIEARGTESTEHIFGGESRSAAIVAASAGLAAVSAAILTAIQLALQRFWQTRKLPWAFQ
jgi:hypothetical protein